MVGLEPWKLPSDFKLARSAPEDRQQDLPIADAQRTIIESKEGATTRPRRGANPDVLTRTNTGHRKPEDVPEVAEVRSRRGRRRPKKQLEDCIVDIRDCI